MCDLIVFDFDCLVEMFGVMLDKHLDKIPKSSFSTILKGGWARPNAG
jgi:hypothetical protein